MPAPDRTIWGDIVNSKGRIGLVLNESITSTTCTVSVGTWFWSKWGCTDNTNKIYFDENASSASTYRGYANISHTVSSGDGWSTQNQTRILNSDDYQYTYTRGTTAKTIWYRAKFMNVEAVDGVMHVKASVTIPALEKYTITYNANGGTGAPSSQSKFYGININISAVVPTRSGYSFVGWGKSATATTVSYNPGGGCGENTNLTLYAIWKANTYTITYNANGGTGVPASQTKTHGVTLTLSSTKPTRTNYTFLGWSASSAASTATYAAGGSYTGNGNATLYAVWALAYTNPRITNVKVFRSDSTGAASDDGKYFKASFNWATDKTVSSIVIRWQRTTYDDTNWASSTQTASGTSGSIASICGGGGLSIDYSYRVQIIVTDASGSTTVTKIFSAKVYPIDIYKDGKGVAILKPATTSGRLDIGADTYVNGVKVTGNTLAIKGTNTISTTANDTIANWKGHGNAAVHWYNSGGTITDKPSTYGFLLNLVNGSDVHQLWFPQVSGGLAHRGGNNSGWSGTWKKVLDDTNYNTYCVPKTGGNFTGFVKMDNSVNTVGWFRLHNDYIAFYKSSADAQSHTNRKCWIGYDGTTNTNLKVNNEAGGYNYVNKAWTVSSDNRFKDFIDNIPDVFVDIWMDLQPKVFKWNEKNYGDDGVHFGLIAQDVIATFAKYNLDHRDYGFVNSFTLQGDDTEYYGIAYDEYHMLTAMSLKKSMAKQAEQQKQIDNLQAQIDELKKLINK